MRRVPSSASLLALSSLSLLALTLGACSGSKGGIKGAGITSGDGGSGSGSSANPGSSGGSNDDDSGSSSEAPHALGTITLGEMHPSTGGTSTPLVSATFVPDATQALRTCSTQLAGCAVAATPECRAAGSSCGEGQACQFDSACNASCVAVCSLACGTGQECYFPSPGAPACRTTQTFDAGALAFAGTTTPITLFPPYEYASSGDGSPFLAGASLEVQASGAAAAGFDKFDQKFTATTFLQTSPAMASIPSAEVFGTGSIPISWAPGNDTVSINLIGAAGDAICPASDASGSFQIPRAAVNAVLGTTSGETSLVIFVSRTHQDWFKNATTHGTLTTATVQPVGWLELSTTSQETASFTGTVAPACLASETQCPDGCFNLQTDQYHCGSCSTVCASTQTCQDAVCTTGTPPTTDCDTCANAASTGTCASAYNTCNADTSCVDYSSCATACAPTDDTCLQGCVTTYAAGASVYGTYVDCVCDTACPTQCATECE